MDVYPAQTVTSCKFPIVIYNNYAKILLDKRLGAPLT